jgi:hypothetical protein
MTRGDEPSAGSVGTGPWLCCVRWSLAVRRGPPRGECSGGGFGGISPDIDATTEAIAFVLDPDAVS